MPPGHLRCNYFAGCLHAEEKIWFQGDRSFSSRVFSVKAGFQDYFGFLGQKLKIIC